MIVKIKQVEGLQTALDAKVSGAGSGTVNYVTKWSSTTGIVDSQIRDDGTSVGIAIAPSSFDKVLIDADSLSNGLKVQNNDSGYAVRTVSDGTNATTANIAVEGIAKGATAGVAASVNIAGQFLGGSAVPADVTTAIAETFGAVIRAHESTKKAMALYVDATTNNTADNIGLYVSTANAGAGNNYAIIVPSGGGNVGLGVSLPTTQLHVVGDFRLVNGSQAAGYILQTDVNGVSTWVDPSTLSTDGNGIYDGSGTVPTTTAVTITDTLNFGSDLLYIDEANSEVGILTNNPAATLDVRGNVNIGAAGVSNQLTFNGTEANIYGGNGSFLDYITGFRHRFYTYGTLMGQWDTANFNLYTNIIMGAGENIVIGTGNLSVGAGATPSAKLHATGTIRFDGLTTTPAAGHVLRSTNANGDLDWVDLNLGQYATTAYVDSIAAGLDPKESVRFTTLDTITGTYNPTGGTGGSGAFTGVDLTDTGDFDLDGNTVAIGDRILIKNQTDAKQNGIYEVTTAGATGAIERASDQDGTPSNEVSSGNYTFVELGATYENVGFVLQGDGILTLNTDNLVWVVFTTSGNGIYSGSGTVPTTTAVTITDTLNFDSGTLYIDAINDRVGIGTTSPDVIFNVEDAAPIHRMTGTAGSSRMQIISTTGIATVELQTNTANLDPYLTFIHSPEAQSIRFALGVDTSDNSFKIGKTSLTDGSLFVIERDTAHVGIGTANPTAKLQVNATSTDDILELVNGSTRFIVADDGQQAWGIGTGASINSQFAHIANAANYNFGFGFYGTNTTTSVMTVQMLGTSDNGITVATQGGKTGTVTGISSTVLSTGNTTAYGIRGNARNASNSNVAVFGNITGGWSITPSGVSYAGLFFAQADVDAEQVGVRGSAQFSNSGLAYTETQIGVDGFAGGNNSDNTTTSDIIAGRFIALGNTTGDKIAILVPSTNNDGVVVFGADNPTGTELLQVTGDTHLNGELKLSNLTTTPAAGYILQSTDANGNTDWVDPSTLGLGGETLSQTLTIGNTTGANDIIVSNGQKITTSSATTTDRMEITFNSLGLGADDISIGRNSGGDGGSLFMGPFSSTMRLRKSGGTRKFSFEVGTNDHFRFSDNGGAPTLNLINGNDGLLRPATLTANRTWTLPDATGTIALTSQLTGDGIYDGSGTVPTTTAVTITNTLDFDSGTFYINAERNRVGIGLAPSTVTNSTWKLHIQSNTQALPTISSDTMAVISNNKDVAMSFISPATSNMSINFGSNTNEDNGRILYDNTGRFMSFWTQAAERARIDGDGNLVVGATSASAKLHIVKNSITTPTLSTGTVALFEDSTSFNAEAAISVLGGTSGRSKVFLGNSSDEDVIGLEQFANNFIITSQGTERIRMEAGGDTGISENNPQGRLHVTVTNEGDNALVLDGLNNTSIFGQARSVTRQGAVTTTGTGNSLVTDINITVTDPQRVVGSGRFIAKGSTETVGGDFMFVAEHEGGTLAIVGQDVSVKHTSSGTPDFEIIATNSTTDLIQFRCTGGGQNLTWLVTLTYELVDDPVI
jgi:hypothetical protein